MTLPAGGMTLADKQAVNEALLRSGATIGEMNAVRKHLSAIKGGRLAVAARPARLVTLVSATCRATIRASSHPGRRSRIRARLADVAEIVKRFRLELPRPPGPCSRRCRDAEAG